MDHRVFRSYGVPYSSRRRGCQAWPCQNDPFARSWIITIAGIFNSRRSCRRSFRKSVREMSGRQAFIESLIVTVQSWTICACLELAFLFFLPRNVTRNGGKRERKNCSCTATQMFIIDYERGISRCTEPTASAFAYPTFKRNGEECLFADFVRKNNKVYLCLDDSNYWIIYYSLGKFLWCDDFRL